MGAINYFIASCHSDTDSHWLCSAKECHFTLIFSIQYSLSKIRVIVAFNYIFTSYNKFLMTIINLLRYLRLNNHSGFVYVPVIFHVTIICVNKALNINRYPLWKPIITGGFFYWKHNTEKIILTILQWCLLLLLILKLYINSLQNR